MSDAPDPTTPPAPAAGVGHALPWFVAGAATVIALVAVGALVLGGGGGGGDGTVAVGDPTGDTRTTAIEGTGATDDGVDPIDEPDQTTDDTVGTPTSASGATTATRAPGGGGTTAAGSATTSTVPSGPTVTTAGGGSATTSTSTSTTSTSSTSTSTSTSTTSTTSTSTTGGRRQPQATLLNPSLTPVHGSTSLASGFTPDPFARTLTAGGQIDVGYLGGGCSGHATSAPSVAVNYTAGTASLLRFYFVGSSDSTMIVRTPSGGFQCVDDSFGTPHPALDFNAPASGRYDVWIGSFAAGGSVSGTFRVTANPANHP